MRSRRHVSLSRTLWVLILYDCLRLSSANTNVSAPLTRDIGAGHPSCPCLPEGEVSNWMDAIRETDQGNKNKIKQILTLRQPYGVGCHAHDVKNPLCLEDSPCAKTRNMVPATIGCDTSWCQRRWCYVDPRNCSLAHRRSDSFFHHKFFSYATCGEMDVFTNEVRFASLEGEVFRMGLNSNSGGWMGAYSKDKVHFEGTVDRWSGLAMDFVTSAATQGKFQFRITPPPEWLWNASVEYFQSESNFDFCVYATSLGYLDMCIAQYTVTDQRAASTDWLLLGSVGLYLVATDEKISVGQWHSDAALEFYAKSYYKSIAVIFSPFTGGTWFFIVVVFIPALGCLMVIHERGRGGSSAFPTEEVVLVTNRKTGESKVKRIHIPLYKACVKSIYVAFLAVLLQTYEPAVSTLGAKIQLLGMAFFILTIVAVYTANLAAILTQNTQSTTVANIEEGIARGYRFCCERKNMENVLKAYPSLEASMFVVDPVELGGDGLPGFSCSNCSSRNRVFDFINPKQATSDSPYCHAAIAPEEDLEVLLARGVHCNKTIVGKPVQMVQTGMPVFERVSPQLISYFLKLMNDGQYTSALVQNRPASTCQTLFSEDSNGQSLSLDQLMGIWVISGGFVVLGLLFALSRYCYKRFCRRKTKTKQIYKRDQRCEKVDALGLNDTWLASGVDNLRDMPEMMQDSHNADDSMPAIDGMSRRDFMERASFVMNDPARRATLLMAMQKPSSRRTAHEA